jgi:hypothetical protein
MEEKPDTVASSRDERKAKEKAEILQREMQRKSFKLVREERLEICVVHCLQAS